MGLPITTVAPGVCFAFPDVCDTVVPFVGTVPIPYANVAKLQDAEDAAETVKAGGNAVVTVNSKITDSSGAEPAKPSSGVVSGTKNKACTFPKGSTSVFVEGHAVVRMFDPTSQNESDGAVGNAVGTVLGGVPTVLVGG